MIVYLLFLILSILPLIEGELLGISRFILLASCLPLSIYLYKQKSPRPLHVIFIAFLFFATLSTIFSPVPYRSVNTLILYFAYFIYFLVGQSLVENSKKSPAFPPVGGLKPGFYDVSKLLAFSVLLPGITLSLLSFYFLISKQPPPFSSMNILWANFGHNHLVDYLIFSLPIGLAFFFIQEKLLGKLIFLGINLILTLGFIFSFSRLGIFIAIFEFILFVILWHKSHLSHDRRSTAVVHLSILILISLLVFVGLVMIGGYYRLGSEKVSFLNNFILKKAIRGIPWSIRWDYLNQAWQGIKERPLLGWGLDNFRYVSAKFQSPAGSWSWYTHNHYIEMFVELGIIGGLLFLLLIITLLITALKKLYYSNRGRYLNSINIGNLLLIGLITSAFYSFFDYGWQFPSVFLVFWVIAGYLSSANNQIKSPAFPPAGGLKAGLCDNVNNLFQPFLLFVGIFLFIIASLEFSSNLLFFQALNAKAKGNSQQAEKFYQLSFKVWPFKLEKYQGLIKLYQETGEDNKYSALLHQLIKIEPFNDGDYKLLAQYYENKNTDQSVNYYWQGILLNPVDNMDSYSKLIDLWTSRKEKNWPQLYQLLATLEKAKGKDCILKCLGFENEKKIENTLLSLISSKDLNQLDNIQQAKIYYWLVVLTTSKQDWLTNIDWLEHALDLDDKMEYELLQDDLTVVQKIKENYQNKKYQEVERLAPQIILDSSKTSFYQKFYLSDAYYYLASALFDQGKTEKALEYWQQSLTINPWSDKAYLGLAQYYQKLNDQKQQRQILKKCVEVNGWSKQCQLQLTK